MAPGDEGKDGGGVPMGPKRGIMGAANQFVTLHCLT